MIKSAAIKVNDKIYEGHRHYQIIPTALDDNPDVNYITKAMQGFVTDDGVFVDRCTAAQIAYDCGQIQTINSKLYSEDLD